MGESFPSFSKPIYIGEFMNDYEAGDIQLGRADVRYLYEPLVNKTNLNLDLSAGFKEFKQKSDDPEKLDSMLKFILRISRKGSTLRKVLHNAEFVAWRGVLTAIASSPYPSDNYEGWKIACYRVHDVIFMCQYPTDTKLKMKSEETAEQKMFTYFGFDTIYVSYKFFSFKFEQYLTTDEKNGVPKTDEPVSTLQNHTAVLKFKLGSSDRRVQVLVGAEMDGLDNRDEFVELKTQVKCMGFGRYWSQKQMKWWLQSFLGGVDRIIVGIRNFEGFIKSVTEVRTSDLATRSEKWKPHVCMNYLLNYLNTVRKTLTESPHQTLFITEHNAGMKMFEIRQATDEELLKYGFISGEFIQQFEK